MASNVAYVLVIGFHHQLGPQVDFALPALPLVPESTRSTVFNASPYRLPEEWKFMPFLALPDGAHQSEEDYTYFVLPPSSDPDVNIKTPLFGISSYRQIEVTKLTNRTADMTRNTVQKAIVVLTSIPLYGIIRGQVSFVNRLFFEQLDFSKTKIIEDFAATLPSLVSQRQQAEAIFSGASARGLINKFGARTLILAKIVLLQKKVLIYGNIAHRLCALTLGLLSLVPGVLFSLTPASFESEDDLSELKSSGFPLDIFGEHRLVQPYFSLLQMDSLLDPATTSFLVGVSNKVISQHRHIALDVFVDIDAGKIEVYDPALASALALTASDKKFMAEIVQHVEANYKPEEELNELDFSEQLEFAGSNTWIRQMFQDYFIRMVATVASVDMMLFRAGQLEKARQQARDVTEQIEDSVEDHDNDQVKVPLEEEEGEVVLDHVDAVENKQTDRVEAEEAKQDNDVTPNVHSDDFNTKWIARWRGTSNYKQWHSKLIANELTFDYKHLAGHPTHVDDLQAQLTKGVSKGLTNVASGVANGIETIRQVDLAPLQENLSKAVSTGSQQLGKAAVYARSTFGSFLANAATLMEFDFDKTEAGSVSSSSSSTAATTTASTSSTTTTPVVSTASSTSLPPATSVSPSSATSTTSSSKDSSGSNVSKAAATASAVASSVGGWARRLAERASSAVKVATSSPAATTTAAAANHPVAEESVVTDQQAADPISDLASVSVHDMNTANSVDNTETTNDDMESATLLAATSEEYILRTSAELPL